MTLTLAAMRAAYADPDESAECVRNLGPLANWIVRHKIREKAAERQNRPDFKKPVQIEQAFLQPGGCLVPVVSGSDLKPFLEDAFLLPLHWRKGEQHDHRLPPGLSTVADQVIEKLRPHGAFSLHLMLPGQKGPSSPLFADCPPGNAGSSDASGQPGWDFPSAFVPLATALWMLEENVAPDYRSVSTGALGPNGTIARVGGIAEKLEAVRRFPPGGSPGFIEKFFIPEHNVKEADDELKKKVNKEPDHTQSRVVLHGINALETRLDKALAGLLAASGLQPDPDTAAFSVLQTWYRRLQNLDANLAEDYYRNVLYRQIAARFLNHPGPMDPSPTSFVSVVSTPAIIGLAQELFRFRRVLVLHTIPDPESTELGEKHPDDLASKAEEVYRLLKGKAESIECKPFVYNRELSGKEIRQRVSAAMQEPIETFLQGTQPGDVMWDTTSGLRLFSLTLEKVFARRGDWMLNIAAQRSHQNQLIPFTENVLVWKHGESWQTHTEANVT